VCRCQKSPATRAGATPTAAAAEETSGHNHTLGARHGCLVPPCCRHRQRHQVCPSLPRSARGGVTAVSVRAWARGGYRATGSMRWFHARWRRASWARSASGHGEVARGRGAGGARSLGGCLHARAWAGKGGGGMVKPWWTSSLGSYRIVEIKAVRGRLPPWFCLR
jgi:hypothetical protein